MEYGIQLVEFFSFEILEGVEFNGWMIKFCDFCENCQYLVFMYFYGGLGS